MTVRAVADSHHQPDAKRPKLGGNTEQEELAKAGDDALIIANGWAIDAGATPATLQAKDHSRFALTPDDRYRAVDLTDRCVNHLVAGGEAWTDKSEVQSPWAVWGTPTLLSPAECCQWIQRAEREGLETGDFIFKTGRNGFERMQTGARRHSATRLIEDKAFAKLMEERIREAVPKCLADGRRFRGVRRTFLLTRYVEGQYFAPHFDGCMEDSGDGSMGAFTVVLFLNDDFEGGATHYLPGQGSEIDRPIAVRPCPGCAVVHRVVSVLHCGGQVLKGTKYIMQFGLMYDAAAESVAKNLVKPLRWGA